MTQALLFVNGLALLVLGGDGLVRGASRLALSFGLSPLVVGLTGVAFGTSAPEMAVSVARPPAARPTWRWATSSAATSSTCCSYWVSPR